MACTGHGGDFCPWAAHTNPPQSHIEALGGLGSVVACPLLDLLQNYDPTVEVFGSIWWHKRSLQQQRSLPKTTGMFM